jgi:hypothetical protein
MHDCMRSNADVCGHYLTIETSLSALEVTYFIIWPEIQKIILSP